MQRGKRPYSRFGQRLSQIRKELRESMHEVSGAIEVDTDVLEKFESGEDRPSEDLLLLLISHFEVKDEEADELFELAGYSMNSDPASENIQMQPIVVVPMETRIMYTDSAVADSTDKGLVVSFMQNGVDGQAIPISRVGMSLDQAQKLVETLSESIKNAHSTQLPKLISAPKQQKRSQKSE